MNRVLLGVGVPVRGKRDCREPTVTPDEKKEDEEVCY